MTIEIDRSQRPVSADTGLPGQALKGFPPPPGKSDLGPIAARASVPLNDEEAVKTLVELAMLPQTEERLRALSRGRWITALEQMQGYLDRARHLSTKGYEPHLGVSHLALQASEQLQEAEQNPLLLLESLRTIRTLVYAVANGAQTHVSFDHAGSVILDANRRRIGPPQQWKPPSAMFISKNLETAVVLQAVADLTTPYALHIGCCDECHTLFYRRVGTRFCSQLCANKASVKRRQPSRQGTKTNGESTKHPSTDAQASGGNLLPPAANSPSAVSAPPKKTGESSAFTKRNIKSRRRRAPVHSQRVRKGD